MDELHRHNKARWEALAAANVAYSLPLLNLDLAAARRVLDPHGVMGAVDGKEVLCLAAGGGQQSAAFALLGARTTVIDFSETQLARDRQALAHYGLEAQLEQGDMRDLSRFAPAAFDIVWHAYSVNFVPDAGEVFDQVKRVLHPGGLYRLQWHNPFTTTVEESGWDGRGYRVIAPYAGGEARFRSTDWDVEDADGVTRKVEGPREFNHRLSDVINGLIGRGFVILGLWEDWLGDPTAEPGSWEHFLSFAPQLLELWARYEPRS